MLLSVAHFAVSTPPQPKLYIKKNVLRGNLVNQFEIEFIAEEFGVVVWLFYFRRMQFKNQLRTTSSISTVLDLCRRTHSLSVLWNTIYTNQFCFFFLLHEKDPIYSPDEMVRKLTWRSKSIVCSAIRLIFVEISMGSPKELQLDDMSNWTKGKILRYKKIALLNYNSTRLISSYISIVESPSIG